MVKDPVCEMDVNEQEARQEGLMSEFQGQTYYFCGRGCKRDFDRNPQQYAGQGQAGDHGGPH